MNWQTMERFAILAGLTTISKLNPGLFEVNGAGHGNRSIGSHAHGYDGFRGAPPLLSF